MTCGFRPTRAGPDDSITYGFVTLVDIFNVSPSAWVNKCTGE
jgi:hypothetical protein